MATQTATSTTATPPTSQQGQGAFPANQQYQAPAQDPQDTKKPLKNDSQPSGAIFTLLPDESRTGGSQAQANKTTTTSTTTTKDDEEPERVACSIREIPLSRWEDEKKPTEITPERVLGRNITPTEQTAIQQAHAVGTAWKSNYDFLDLRDKVDILTAGGFSKEGRRALMESGLVGNSKISPTQQSIPIEERRNLQRIITLKGEYFSLINDVNFETISQEAFELVMNKYTEWLAKAMRSLWIFTKIAQEKDDFDKIEPIRGTAEEIIKQYQCLITRKTASKKLREDSKLERLDFTPQHLNLFDEAVSYWAKLKKK